MLECNCVHELVNIPHILPIFPPDLHTAQHIPEISVGNVFSLLLPQGSYTLTYVLHSLANNPEKQDLLAREAKRLLEGSGGKVRMRLKYIMIPMNVTALHLMTNQKKYC